MSHRDPLNFVKIGSVYPMSQKSRSSFIFTRAMLCVSAIFAVVRCLSVPPFVSNLNGYNVKKIRTTWWPHHFSFWPLAPVPIQRDSFSGGNKYRGWEKLRFSTEIAVYLRNCTRYAHGCYAAYNVNRKSQVADRCVSVPMTLSDL